MTVRFNRKEAMKFLREQARAATEQTADAAWINKVERLSVQCQESDTFTHIAFLGTELLAKSLDPRVDLYAIKPKYAEGNPGTFSARSLAHQVLVPVSAELGFSLGVSGREPLNNQPYFRMRHLDDGTPVRAGGQVPFNYMLELVEEIASMSRDQVEAALRAYILVRRTYQPRYMDLHGRTVITAQGLVAAVSTLVGDSSEGGKRAQAVAAGILDVFAGKDRVTSGRINDPSRKYPGDVCVWSASPNESIEKAFEVRDKPVSMMDVQIFGKKCVDMGVQEAAVLMVSGRQQLLDQRAISAWADGFGLGMRLFHGWAGFISDVLFWSSKPQPLAAAEAVTRIHERLVGVEASEVAVSRWNELVGRGGE